MGCSGSLPRWPLNEQHAYTGVSAGDSQKRPWDGKQLGMLQHERASAVGALRFQETIGAEVKEKGGAEVKETGGEESRQAWKTTVRS